MRSAYERAAVFQNAHALVSRLSVDPHWIAGSDRFWYLSDGVDTKEFRWVDPDRRTSGPAFDHARLAVALSRATGQPYGPRELPFDAIDPDLAMSTVTIKVGEQAWRCELTAYVCTATQHIVAAREGEALSPDGRWAVFIRNHNLWLRDTTTDAESSLTTDGETDFEYGGDAGISLSSVTDALLQTVVVPEVHFSSDSSKALTHRIDARAVEKLALVQSVTGDRPRLHTFRYPTPGVENAPMVQMVVLDFRARTHLMLRHPPFARLSSPEMLVAWNEQGTQVGFLEEARGFRNVKLHVADVNTGVVRVAVQESSDTYINRHQMAHLAGAARGIIWSSERNGWNHLYRVDAQTGATLNPITRGEWVVRELLHVDDKHGYVYFTAGGREAAEDPYYRHLYRARLDGTQLRLLTPEAADHEISFSPSGRYFIDTYSRIDQAPQSVLRDAGGRRIQELQKADITALIARGWQPPERFRVKADDGITDIYGAIFLPSNFDSARRYPVLDSIYPGPQHIRTSKSFGVATWESEQALAELGFVVVTIDGRGTPERSRAFRETAYGNMGSAGGLEDHIAGLRQLAATRTYMDLDRVGIYGHSGGGYAAARALLKFPGFYKVAVASAGDHDLRSYWAEWGERFQGYPVGAEFERQANAPLAANLVGKLLLVHGDLDDNVLPTNTLQLVDALIAANKDFDLLILPNRNHNLIDLSKGKGAPRGKDPYFLRKRWDYFVQYLMGAVPPRDFRITTVDSDP